MLAAAEAYAARQAAVAAAVDRQTGVLWQSVSAADVVASWGTVSGRLQRLVVAGQIAAARLTEPYLSAVLAEQNVQVDADGTIAPTAFGGTAADGRDLGSLVDWPVTGADGVLDRIGQGQDPAVAVRSGGLRLQMLVSTTVQDAGRAAVGTGIAARSGLGYVRVLTPPSCARCVILAGRHYRWNSGFHRHPRCDCRHVPCSEADAPDLVTDPQAYVRSLSDADRDRLLTKAGAQAVRDGADLGQVVNAQRGISVGGLTTTEGTSRRGLAAGQRRLTPEGIYRISSDRQEAVRLLKQHGYLL